MTDNSVSYQVYKSKDETTLKLIELLAQYLELNEVDLTKSSFLAFVVEALSTLTTNNLFYQISSYREFFLTKAQLSGSIYNLAAFLGYQPTEATAAFVNVLFTFPLEFTDNDVTFIIPEGFSLSAGSIAFTTYYSTTINVLNNSQVTITVTEDNKIYNLPYTISTDNGNSVFSMVLPFKQFEVDIQEFQVPEDLQTYQFFDFDVAFTDISKKISEVVVEVRPPGSSGYELYTEYSSLFLMESDTKGYVKRRNDTGFNLQFGNGLIGYQPEPGGTILVTTELTKGLDGNVIAGSVTGKTTDLKTRITDDEGRAVTYTVTNPAPGSGGEDEESIEEVRRNAITNITALERLVTENDYVNTNIIIEDSPLSQNSLPVLKRSDIKVNEISLFSTLLYSDGIVPARNIKYNFLTQEIPRGTVLTHGGTDYYTIFDMSIELLNSVATYVYVMTSIQQIPTLVTSYGSEYDLYSDLLTVTKNGVTADFQLDYKTTESDADTVTCEVEVLETGSTYNMVNDSTASAFTLNLPDYTVLPTGEATYYFTMKHGSNFIAQYTAIFTFRKSLDDFELSNVIYDSTSYTVYDIPAIKASYYDSIDQSDFETSVMQTLVTTLEFKDYKMATDFVNFKLANTYGTMQNMQLNEVDIPAVIDIISDPPTSGDDGDRYIILNGTGDWLGKDNQIAILSDSTSLTWAYSEAKTEQMVYVTNLLQKYIFCQAGWVVPIYEIPLQIELDIFKTSTYAGSNSDLTSEVREAVVEAFEGRFGINVALYRSEIIDVVQEVVGVEHCRLIKPESSIFFNFDLDKLTQEQLLSYGPEYIFFGEDDIAIRIFS